MNSRTNIPFTRALSVDLAAQLDQTVLDVLRYGDGGVDVTGVLNCGLAEGAMKRRSGYTFFIKLISVCWELHFFAHQQLEKIWNKIVNGRLHFKKSIILKQNVTCSKVTRLKGNIGRDIGTFFYEYDKCFFYTNTSILSLTSNFTILLSTKIDDFLTRGAQSGEVMKTSVPKRLVPSFRDLSQVSLAGQPTENNTDRAMVLYSHPLWRVFGKSKIQILQSFTDTWQSNSAKMLKSRKDTPRNFLKLAWSAAFFIGTLG